jgi:hypothetical protein
MNERQIFSEALSQHDPVARAEFLRRACGGDDALIRRVERLLACHDSPGTLLDLRPVELIEALVDDDAERDEPDPASLPERELAPYLEPPGLPGSLGRLGQHEVLGVIGRGGFGIVVQALDESLGRLVAIKILSPDLCRTSPPRKRFLREAQMAARVRHENVAQIFAIHDRPLPYLVMELVKGRTLQRRLDEVGPTSSRTTS